MYYFYWLFQEKKRKKKKELIEGHHLFHAMNLLKFQVNFKEALNVDQTESFCSNLVGYHINIAPLLIN